MEQVEIVSCVVGGCFEVSDSRSPFGFQSDEGRHTMSTLLHVTSIFFKPCAFIVCGGFVWSNAGLLADELIFFFDIESRRVSFSRVRGVLCQSREAWVMTQCCENVPERSDLEQLCDNVRRERGSG